MTRTELKKEAVELIELECCEEWSELRRLSTADEVGGEIQTLLADHYREMFGEDQPEPDDHCDNVGDLLNEYLKSATGHEEEEGD